MTRPGETFEELRAAMDGRASADGLDRLPAVFAAAEQAHRGQLRRSRDPYITHPVATATIVASWGRPADVVFAALLHDVPDTGHDVTALSSLVGPQTVAVVRAAWTATSAASWGEVAHGTTPLPSLVEKAAVVKLADRLHNSRTWEYVPLPRVRTKAAQTLDVVVPMAHRLGLDQPAAELATRSRAALAQGPPLVRSAVALVPERHRTRYALEWAGDLACTDPGRARRRLVAGVLWSALQMRLASGM